MATRLFVRLREWAKDNKDIASICEECGVEDLNEFLEFIADEIEPLFVPVTDRNGKTVVEGDLVVLSRKPPYQFKTIKEVHFGLSPHGEQKGPWVDYVDNKGWNYVTDIRCIKVKTPEQIKRDKKKTYTEYWDCADHFCKECPCMINGERPYEYYQCLNCNIAQGLDIADNEEITEHFYQKRICQLI